ncbi:LANO_0F00188g1_1 [Lachancea nothofagi CBS 11611]|uniref:L-lactate dehydrogenase n=1 Tax=Lachancea nothofagi CBS 11611 TaxID=1266666 RepID=A0A1G4K547_9SACH|nr:LANO_0F00188g1_1 [Lachancea nothofagi CBS 11611]
MAQDKKIPNVRTGTNLVKIVVVGVGSVGSATAYTLLLSGVVSEIVLIDINKEKAEGESMDLNHAAPSTTRSRAGDYSDCAGAEIVIVTCGINQKHGQTRMDLAAKNAKIMQDIIPNVAKYAPDTILLIATNPVDVLTYVSYRASGFPLNRVIGSGTVLDTARFKYILGEHFDIASESIDACVVGEHGDSGVPVWSLTSIDGLKLRDYCEKKNHNFDQDTFHKIFEQTRDAAYDIIKRKGYTSYGIAAGLLRIVKAILDDTNSTLTVSTVGDYYGVKQIALSVPIKLNKTGAHQADELSLDEKETVLMKKSAGQIKSALRTLDLE